MIGKVAVVVLPPLAQTQYYCLLPWSGSARYIEQVKGLAIMTGEVECRVPEHLPVVAEGTDTAWLAGMMLAWEGWSSSLPIRGNSQDRVTSFLSAGECDRMGQSGEGRAVATGKFSI